jgi:hypothetical protein
LFCFYAKKLAKTVSLKKSNKTKQSLTGPFSNPSDVFYLDQTLVLTSKKGGQNGLGYAKQDFQDYKAGYRARGDACGGPWVFLRTDKQA